MNKKLLALVGGAGVATGVLLAPDKGSRTVKKLTNKGKKLVDRVSRTASGEIDSVKKSIRNKVEDVKKAIGKRARAAADATLHAEERMHRKVQGAIRTAAKAVGAEEKKTVSRSGRSGAAKKAVSAAKKAVRAAKPSRLKKAIAKKSAGKSSASASNGKSSSRSRSMANGKAHTARAAR